MFQDLQDLNQELAQNRKDQRQQTKLLRDISSAERQLEREKARLANTRQRIEEAQVDVEKLETQTLTSLFYQLLGRHKEQLQTERHELLEAEFQFQHAQYQVKVLTDELSELQGQLAALGNVEEWRKSLLARKENLIRSQDDKTAQELFEIDDEIASLQSDMLELKEAGNAANQLFHTLNSAIHALESAETWGGRDMAGGGLLTTNTKHREIDRANQHIKAAQAKIHHLNRELADVNMTDAFQLQLNESESFSDYWFDGLLIDWNVQQKIKDSLSRTRQVQYQVDRTRKRVASKWAQCSRQVNARLAWRERIVEEA